MTTYKYKGVSPDGARVSGVIKAYDEFEAVSQLRETCSVVTKIEAVPEQKEGGVSFGSRRIKDKELAILCSQFAIILTSGLPIDRCVEMVAAQARSREIQRVLEHVAEDVSGGYSLAQSFTNAGTAFPVTFVETIRAGEQSGTLELCFDRLHKYYDKSAKTHAKLVSTLTYPVLVLIVAAIVFMVIMLFAVPMFTSAMAELIAGNTDVADGATLYLQKDGSVAATGTNDYTCQGKPGADVEIAGQSVAAWDKGHKVVYTFDAAANHFAISTAE